MRAPFQILAFPFVIEGKVPLYCIFKRSDEGYWQGVAGGGEDAESFEQAVIREAREEAGLENIRELITLKSMCTVPADIFPGDHAWGKELLVIPEYSFGIEIESKNEIILSEEHTEFAWLEYAQAAERLKWDSNRNALWELNQLIKAKVSGRDN